MLKPIAAGISHRGGRREDNEDAVAWEVEFASGRALGMVADGMGGYEGGEVASRLAVETAQAGLLPLLGQAALDDTEIEKALADVVTSANRRIQAVRGANPEWSKMGTTLVMALVSQGFAHLAHLGDSRCYLLSGRRLELKTRDDTIVQAMLDVGEITEAEVSRVPFRNVLTKALGVESRVAATTSSFPVGVGDILILCSDGVTGALPSDQWQAVMAGGGSLEAQAQLLIDACLANDAEDNISVVLIRLT